MEVVTKKTSDDPYLVHKGEDATFQTSKWDRILYKEAADNDGVPAFEAPIPGMGAFMQELSARLYSGDKPKETPKDCWMTRAQELVSSNSMFDALKAQTAGDVDMTRLAVGAIGRAVLEALPEPPKVEDPDILAGSVEALREAGADDLADQYQVQSEICSAALDEWCEKIDLPDAQSKVRSSVKAALQEVQEQIDENNLLDSVLSIGPANQSKEITRESSQKKRDMMQKIKSSESLMRIVKMFGRMRAFAKGKKETRIRSMGMEINSIECGNDLQKVLPTELVYLGDSDLEDIFFVKWAEKSLLQWSHSENKCIARGPAIVAIDSSGSMGCGFSGGTREEWAKALGLAIASEMLDDKRSCTVLIFDTEIQHEIKVESQDQVLEALTWGIGGGTDWTSPMDRAMDLIKNDIRSDFVLITDGEDYVPQERKIQWEDFRKKTGTTAFGLLLGGTPHELNSVCDRVWSGNADQGALELIFGDDGVTREEAI